MYSCGAVPGVRFAGLRACVLPWLVAAVGLLTVAPAPSAEAQSVRGTVRDAGGVPVPGVVVQAVDTAGAIVGRSLSNAQGEFLVALREPGSYTIRTLRIGFRPVVSEPIALSVGQQVTRHVELTGIPVALGSVRIDTRSVCAGVKGDSAAAAFSAWEQVRIALDATELTAGAALRTTVVTYNRTLDALGRTVVKQDAAVHTGVVRQPWLERPIEVLRRDGYVIDEGAKGTTYFAPGLSTLASDAFLADHCLRFGASEDGSHYVVTFEPNADRRRAVDVRGTARIDKASSELRSLSFSYTNLPYEQERAAGGRMEFVRMQNGTWAIARWNIRMPIMTQRIRSVDMGGPALVVDELRVGGGELIAALSGTDTVWAGAPLVLAGTIRDSVSGAPVQNARAALVGTALQGTTDPRGRFAIPGVLPGEYMVEVRTDGLDSFGAVYQMPISFTDSASRVEVLLPTAQQIAATLCGSARAGSSRLGTGLVIGRARVRGDTVPPTDLKVVAEWADISVRNAAGSASVNRVLRWMDAKTDSSGGFRLCGVPTNTALTITGSAGSASAAPIELRVPGGQFVRTEIVLDADTPPLSSFSGAVTDSAGNGVPGVEVLLPELSVAATTDSTGRVRLLGIVPGHHRVIARRVGFGALDTEIEFVANRTTERHIVLARIAILAEARVEASGANLPLSFDEHRKTGLGTFITRDALEAQESRRLSDILRVVPGLGVVNGRGSQGWVLGSRTSPSLGATGPRRDATGAVQQTSPTIYFPEAFEARSGMTAGCYARVYLNDALMNPEMPARPFDVNAIPPTSIEAIEYYAGPSETPIKYARLNSSCGVLVIHSRRSP